MNAMTLLESPKYKSFVKDRNKEIEKIQLNAQTDTSRLLFEVLDRITGFVSHMALDGKISVYNLDYLTKQVDTYVWQQFNSLLPLLIGRLKRMRRATFVLTYFSELEAIARATKRTTQLSLHDFKTALHEQTHKETILDQQWDTRIWHVLGQLRSRILDAFRRAIARDLSPKEVVDVMKKAYPEIKTYRMPPRTLKPLKEAFRDEDAEKKEFEFYHDLTNDEDWELAVSAYKDTELPASRFDQEAMYDESAGYMRYNWEIEQDLTDDFVSQVRDGQVQAANDLGIEEFVWGAIIDNKTCEECCLPRNGKTTSEIEKMGGGDCDGTVPPLHPNCRCDIAPVASTDEVDGPDWKSFEEWLAA